MNVVISNADGTPIYEQVYKQIKNAIIAGTLSEGDALPSIRSLSKDLRISVITTKRAYDELEHDGYIYTVAAKGCFVAERNIEFIKEERLFEIENYMRKIFELSRPCGITKSEIQEILNIVSEEE